MSDMNLRHIGHESGGASLKNAKCRVVVRCAGDPFRGVSLIVRWFGRSEV